MLLSERARFLSRKLSLLNATVAGLAERLDDGNLSASDFVYVRQKILYIQTDVYLLQCQAEREDEESNHIRDTLKKLYRDLQAERENRFHVIPPPRSTA